MIISMAELEKYFGKEATPAGNEGADHDFAGRVEGETAARAGKGSEKDGKRQVTRPHFETNCPEGPRPLPAEGSVVIYPPSPPIFHGTAGSWAVKGATHRRLAAACP